MYNLVKNKNGRGLDAISNNQIQWIICAQYKQNFRIYFDNS